MSGNAQFVSGLFGFVGKTLLRPEAESVTEALQRAAAEQDAEEAAPKPAKRKLQIGIGNPAHVIDPNEPAGPEEITTEGSEIK